MIFLVEPFRPYEQMEISERPVSIDCFLFDCACWNSGDRIRKRAQRRTRRGIWVRLRRRGLALCFMDRQCGPQDQRSLPVLPNSSFTPFRTAKEPGYRLAKAPREGRWPLPMLQARLRPPGKDTKPFILNGSHKRLENLTQWYVTKCNASGRLSEGPQESTGHAKLWSFWQLQDSLLVQ
jgi:hypothetical protein